MIVCYRNAYGPYFLFPVAVRDSPAWELQALLINSLSGWDKWTLHDSAECVEFQEI